MKKLLWFSRHEMTDWQKNDLEQIFGDWIEVHQVNKTIRYAKELEVDMASYDAAAVVMPLHLQQQMLKILGGKPMFVCLGCISTDGVRRTLIMFGHSRMTSAEIAQLRRKCGKTQQQMAEFLGVNQSQISRWERGVQPVPMWVENLIDCYPKLEQTLDAFERKQEEEKK